MSSLSLPLQETSSEWTASLSHSPIEALAYMAKHPNLYLGFHPYSEEQKASEEEASWRLEFPVFSLTYPSTRWVERFGLSMSPRSNEYQPIPDLIATIQALYEAFDLPRPKALSQLIQQSSDHDLERVCSSLPNVLALKQTLLNVQRDLLDRTSKRPLPSLSDGLLCHILDQSYYRMMDEDPRRLNRVPDVHRTKNYLYGELKPSLVTEMVRQHLGDAFSKRGKASLFMDFGSGIGNVVLQVAAMTGCQAIGVEILPLPLCLSHQFKAEFVARLGSAYGHVELASSLDANIQLVEGDFLSHPLVQAHIEKVDVLLVNNATFASDVNQRLMDLFLSLKEGAKIISLMNFAPVKRKFSHYHAFRPTSIFKVEKYPYGSDCVSWTSTPGHYYVHTVDRASLQQFVSQTAAAQSLPTPRLPFSASRQAEPASESGPSMKEEKHESAIVLTDSSALEKDREEEQERDVSSSKWLPKKRPFQAQVNKEPMPHVEQHQ